MRVECSLWAQELGAGNAKGGKSRDLIDEGSRAGLGTAAGFRQVSKLPNKSVATSGKVKAMGQGPGQ